MKDIVSIIIPCYNHGGCLSSALESAINQTYDKTEIIVVDDGSTDNSLDVARSFESRGVKVLAQENQGACAARNQALHEAEGDYIQYLDADDLLAPNKIELQVQRLREEPKGTVAASPWERFYETPGDYEPLSKPLDAWRDFEDPLDWLILAAEGRAMSPPHAWLVPRPITGAAGLWDESLVINQDGEYFARVLLESSKIAFCSDTCVYYRSENGDGISDRRDLEALRSKYYSLRQIEKYMLRQEDSPRVRQACAKQLESFVHGTYPDAPDLVEAAETRIRQLGKTLSPPSGGEKYNFFVRLLGWKVAKRLRRIYYRFWYGQTV